MLTLKRWQLVFGGLFLLFLWGICVLCSVVPGSDGDYMQRFGEVILPALAMLAFWRASVRRR
jgi:hypothetical protein